MNPPDAVDTSAEQAWQRARALLLSKLGQTAFDLGVKSLRLFAADAEMIRFVAPSPAAATWIQAHHPGALEDALRSGGSRGHGSAVVPADEALAHVALEASGRPMVVSNVELSDARVAGLGRDVIGTFLHELAAGAGLTIHVRLIEGSEPEHVLEAIFKALGVALAQSCRPRRREEG